MRIVDQLLSMIRTNELSTVSVRRVFANANASDIDEFFLDLSEKMPEDEAEMIANYLYPFKSEVEQYAKPYLAGSAHTESSGGNTAGSTPENDHSQSTGARAGNDSATGDSGAPSTPANGEQNHE